MIGLNYRLLGHIFNQKRIRGAVWRLARRSVQSALYGLSDALKVTVMGEGRDAAEGELGVCVRELGGCHGRIFLENLKKIS